MMGITVLLVIFLMFCGGRLNFLRDAIHEDFMSKNHTNAVKGIFVVFIILAHFQQYVPSATGLLNFPFIFVREYIGQLIVTPFLFVSGYGIIKVYMRKGTSYLLSFPQKRIFLTLLHFDFGILLFVLVNLMFQKIYSIREYLTALVGWNSIGNSNWYIFAILCLYSITFIAGILLYNKTSTRNLALVTTIGVLAYIFVISFFKKPVFYNTVMCYPAGMWFGIYEEKIKSIIRRRSAWLTIIGLLGGVFMIAFLVSPIYSIKAVCFPLLIFIFTARFSINNCILIWLGEHTFSIYMLQRLPMNIIDYIATKKVNPNAYLLGVLFLTILLAWIFDYFMQHVDEWIKTFGDTRNVTS